MPLITAGIIVTAGLTYAAHKGIPYAYKKIKEKVGQAAQNSKFEAAAALATLLATNYVSYKLGQMRAEVKFRLLNIKPETAEKINNQIFNMINKLDFG
ncbi:MAG: hypothetical protein GY821_16860 [Gammaproteobacteria bacterium]|nr:hypothetical protein [Gammaproteobacteria bacterium]